MLFETSVTTTPVFGLRREMNRLFDDVLTRTAPSSAWSPPVDVREDDSEITITAELPGVDPNHVEVTADAGILTIRGQKSEERKEGQNGQYHLVERSFGSFSRSFRLPRGVDDSKITANFGHGILMVRVPKAALPQPKKIAIGSSGGGNGNTQVRGQGSSKTISKGGNGGESSNQNGASRSTSGSADRERGEA